MTALRAHFSTLAPAWVDAHGCAGTDALLALLRAWSDALAAIEGRRRADALRAARRALTIALTWGGGDEERELVEAAEGL